MKTIVRLTKIKNTRLEKFNLIERPCLKLRPANIVEGDAVEGILMVKPQVDSCVIILHGDRMRRTSLVTEIIDENTFRTQNSLYKIETIRTEE